MLNKIKKTINNKYYRFFRFIFFLRHLLSIFFVAITLFLIIPNFFNYEKRVEIYKSHLLKKYNFKIIKYDDIEYQALPIPRLVFKNATINIHSSPTLMNIKNLKIYPKILSIYDIKNFEVNKIKFIDNYTVLKISDFKFLNSFFFSQKNKFAFNNFNFEITDKKKIL